MHVLFIYKSLLLFSTVGCVDDSFLGHFIEGPCHHLTSLREREIIVFVCCAGNCIVKNKKIKKDSG